MTISSRRWLRFQQRTGWPFGRFITAAWVIGGPVAIYLLMEGLGALGQ